MSSNKIMKNLPKETKNKIIDMVCDFCEYLKDDSKRVNGHNDGFNPNCQNFCEQNLEGERFEFFIFLDDDVKNIMDELRQDGLYEIRLFINFSNDIYIYNNYQQHWIDTSDDMDYDDDVYLTWDKVDEIRKKDFIEFLKEIYAKHEDVWELSDEILVKIKIVIDELEKIKGDI